MNDITINNANAYPRTVGLQGQNPDVSSVLNGGVSGSDRVGNAQGAGNLVVRQGDSALPSATAAGGKNDLVPPRDVVNGPDIQDVKDSLSAFLEGLETKNGQEPGEVGKNEILKTRRDEAEKAAEEKTFDVYQMTSLFDKSNSKRSEVIAQMKLLNQNAASDNAEKRAEAAAVQKKLGFVLASVVLQAAGGITGALGNLNTTQIANTGGKRVALEVSSKLLETGSAVLKYFEDGEGAERQAVRQNQEEAVRGMVQAGKDLIADLSRTAIQMTDKVAQTLEKCCETTIDAIRA